jgi:hypothetical protein
MNEDRYEELERLLQSVPLAEPSAELDRRVAALWQAAAPRRRRWKLPAMLTAAAAVAAGLLLVITQPWQPRGEQPAGAPIAPLVAGLPPATTAPVERSLSQPVRIERTWSALRSKEVVRTEGAVPMQRIQRQVLRQVQWFDGEEHARIEWTIPSEETDLVPLEYN